VLPTSSQQISFTVLVVVAFVLKTFDILHLIIRQASTDMFFIDWEKPKAGMKNFLIIGNFFCCLRKCEYGFCMANIFCRK